MIETISVSRTKLPFFSKEDLDFIYDQESISEFIGLPFGLQNINKQIELKQNHFNPNLRENLAQTLKANYAAIEDNQTVLDQIELLGNENTYTVTTGHQLCLYGGALYFFIKILHTIRLAEALKKANPEKNFIPIFWMASEDHDSEEIQSLNLFGKTLTWDHKQKGAVGKFDLRGLSEVKKELLELFRADEYSELSNSLDTLEGKTYGEAFRNWVHYLFGSKGLLVLDADQKPLKKEMIPVFERELRDSFSDGCIQQTNEALKTANRKCQIHSREINLFYMHKEVRSRIRLEDDVYKVDDNSYSLEEMVKLLHSFPERFSPNVALRPLYQESILPNLCYIGGMAELRYWSQLKGIFQNAEIPFPMLQMRSNILWIDQSAFKTSEKLGLLPTDLFESTSNLQKKVITKEDPNPIDKESIAKAITLLNETYQNAIKNDPGLQAWLGSELKKLENNQASIQSKIEKTKKTTFDGKVKKITGLKERLFPDQKLQERTQNLLHFCNAKGIKERIDDLHKAINPLTNDFTILIEKENDSK
tara:strand:- start:31523 stop:33124 length:1602 start_codon:yes stop_codon:yes gene_type:complete